MTWLSYLLFGNHRSKRCTFKPKVDEVVGIFVGTDGLNLAGMGFQIITLFEFPERGFNGALYSPFKEQSLDRIEMGHVTVYGKYSSGWKP
jgi:hypothetical protein